MEFSKYQHVERFGTVETEGIEFGECLVFPKIDGANGSVWLHNGPGELLRAGSRNRELTLDNDNQGFYAYMLQHDGIRAFLGSFPYVRLYGEWLCLSGDTVIRKTSGGKNSNYMTLREMYAYNQKKVVDVQKWATKDGTQKESVTERNKSWWDRNGYPSIFSLHRDEDKIKANKIKGIFYAGIKKVYQITTRKGYNIKASAEHPFFTPCGFIPLQELSVNDCVAVSSLLNYGKRKRVYGKGTKQIYQKMYDYRDSVGLCQKCGAITCLEVHHKDGDHSNNVIDNYEILCVDCHKKEEAHKKKFTGFVYDYEFDKIISIEELGEEDCYDISMEGTENVANFVANGFIVHNCPHSFKGYRDDAWRKFYVFDVVHGGEEDVYRYIPYNEYRDRLEQFGIDYIPPICTIQNGNEDAFRKALERNTFLVADGKGVGEGIVIKNYSYKNRFGRTTWAKMVTNEFKEKHIREMGAPAIHVDQLVEQKIVDDYCTEEFIRKEYNKLVNIMGGWSSKYIPELLGRVFHELVYEESWNIIKALKYPTVNYKALNALVVNKVKTTLPEVF